MSYTGSWEPLVLLVIFDERNVKYYAKNIFLIYIFHVFSEARDHILILNILFFNKLRQIIPEVRSEMRDLLIENDRYIHTGSLSRVPNIA